MMMKAKSFQLFSIVLILLAPSVCLAEALSFEQAIEIAMEKNPVLQAKLGELKAARGDKIVNGAILPSNPEFEGDYTFDKPFANEGEGGFSLGISQELEIGGQGFLRYGIAKLDYARANAQYQNFRLLTLTEVEIAFYTVLYQQKKQVLLNKVAKQQKRILKGAKSAVSSGLIPPFDYELLKAEAASLIALSIAATTDLNDAQLRLKEVLGMRADDEVTLVDRAPPIQELSSKEVLLEYALENQPALRAATLNAQARKKEASLRARQFIPNPKAFFRYGREDTRIGGFADRDRLFTIGATIPLPITGETRGAYIRAKGEKIAARANLEATTLMIETLLGDSYERYDNLKTTVSRYAGVMKYATRNINLLDTAYMKGRISLDSLLVKRDRFIDAGVNYYDALIALVKAKTDLEIALGSRLSEFKQEGEEP